MGNTLIESENQMRNCIVLVSLFCFHVSAVARPVKTIFDTDMELDVDDVGALAMLHGFANRGDAEILATIGSSLNTWLFSHIRGWHPHVAYQSQQSASSHYR